MRLVRMAAAVVVGVAVLSGCSDGETANETLPSTSSTPAETTESLPPLGPPDFPVPDAARQETAEGALAFAEYYLDLTDFLLPTLESQPLRELSADCAVCTQLADGYDSDRAAGYHYTGGDLSVRSAGAPSVNGEAAEIAFIVDQTAVTVTDSLGAVVPARSSEPYALNGGASLRWLSEKQTWVITQLTLERQ